MIGAPKASAGQRNARAATGPKTAAGRARSAQNALRHGLNRPISADPKSLPLITHLAQEIAGPEASAEVKNLAMQVADADLEVLRARQLRHHFVITAMSEQCYGSPTERRKKNRILSDLLDFKRSEQYDEATLRAKAAFVGGAVEGPEKIAINLTDRIEQWIALLRYERRAITRRNKAILQLMNSKFENR